jgi:hypothetical protein
MRVVRVARPARVPAWRRSWVTAAAFGVVGVVAAVMVLLAPPASARSGSGLGLVAAVAGLAIGIALALAWRAVAGRAPARADDDLERLLGPLFDDSYVLIASPRLPGRSADLAALLVGPPGVRALVARAWDGHYRVSGKRWEYDTHSRRGWIVCRTNPTWDAASAREAVVRWARDAGLEANLPIEAAVAFPRRESQIVLEEPTVEVVTRDNAPWWAARIARAQRLDAARVDRLVRAVVAASEAVPAPVRSSKTAATRG